MSYVPFVRLVLSREPRGYISRAEHDAGKDGSQGCWASSFRCTTCGDTFGFDAPCPRCDEPVVPIVPEAA